MKLCKNEVVMLRMKRHVHSRVRKHLELTLFKGTLLSIEEDKQKSTWYLAISIGVMF